MKLPSINGRIRVWIRRAAAKSPRSAASTICDISAGISFDATEMMPRPPIAISGSVSASSPDSTRKSSGHGAADLGHLLDVAGRFLDADDVGIVASRAQVAASMLQPVRPGTL